MNLGAKKASYPDVRNENNISGASPSHYHQDTATISPVPHTQIIMNANAVMKSHLQVPGTANVPTFTVPALMAIPVDYKTTTTNFNLNSQPQSQKTHPPLSAQSNLAMEEKNCSPPAASGSPVVSAIMWSINGNPPPGAVYSLMNVEMYNNKNIDNNMNSNVFKQNINGCNTNSSAAPDSPVKVNLNEVKITGEPLKFWHAQHSYRPDVK